MALRYLSGISPSTDIRVLRRACQEEDLGQRAHLHKVELLGHVGRSKAKN